MDGLGSPTSVVAVIDISAKVASLLFQYTKEVKDAKEDIARVQLQVESLKNACDSVHQHPQGPDGKKLKASQKLLDALHHACSQLKSLEQELKPGKGHKAMSRVGIRALKWPFNSKAIEKMIQHLSACTQAISLAWQTDETYGVLHFSIPPRPTIQILVKIAVPLFIFAATVCRFVDDRICGDPDEQLQEVLKFQTRSQQSKLDATYLPVLNKLLVRRTDAGLLPLSTTEKDRILKDFQPLSGLSLYSPVRYQPLLLLISSTSPRSRSPVD